jgi:glycosyltransferase involved in cell wall biosynthesis
MPMNDVSPGSSPAVSIITPAYNAQEYLQEAVGSALAQTYRDFELLVIDDGSADRTFDIAKHLAQQDARVHALATEHVGVSAARNAGMRRARGRYIALLDSDDTWFPDFLAAQLAVFERSPATGVVSGNALSIGGPLDGRPLSPPSTQCYPVSVLDMIRDEHAVCVMSVFRRSVFETTGGLSEDLSHSEDYEFWLRAALAGFTFVRNPKPLARYRRHADSASFDELPMLEAMIEVLARTRQSDRADLTIVAAIDRKVAELGERRLWASAKSQLLKGNYTEAARDFAHFSVLRGSASARFVAGVSRLAPAALRVAYQTKLALRV